MGGDRMPKKQKDGRYRAKVTVDGKPIYVSGATKAGLEAEKQRVKEHFRDGIKACDMEFSKAVTQWYTVYKEPHIKSAGTRRNYQSIINKHIIPAFQGRMMRAIKKADIQVFVDSFKGKSDTQITMITAIMKKVFEYAHSEGFISSNPALGLNRPEAVPAKKKDSLTPKQCETVLRVASTHNDGLILLGLYYLGVRRGELLGLMWEDFDWENHMVHIRRDIDFADGGQNGSLKTFASDRLVPVPDDLYAALWPLRGLPGLYVYHGEDNVRPMSESSFKRKWASLMLACGMARLKPSSGQKKRLDLAVDYAVDLTPHWFRHNYITLLYDAGVDAVTAMRLV